jgi:hypothetical protein
VIICAFFICILILIDFLVSCDGFGLSTEMRRAKVIAFYQDGRIRGIICIQPDSGNCARLSKGVI